MLPTYALRVALIWHGTIMKEVCLQTPSEAKGISIGESLRNTFVISGDGMPNSVDLFRRTQFGYVLRLLPGMSGAVTLNGEERRLDDVGHDTCYVSPGDSGLVHLAGVSFFFQFVRPEHKPAHQPLLRPIDGLLVSSLWASLIAQVLFVIAVQLFWDGSPPSRTEEGVMQIVRVNPASASVFGGFERPDQRGIGSGEGALSKE